MLVADGTDIDTQSCIKSIYYWNIYIHINGLDNIPFYIVKPGETLNVNKIY